MHPTLKNLEGQIFTFQPGMIENIKTTLSCGIDQTQMPASGPMNNQGMDLDGVGKNITINGQFLDNPTASVVSGINLRDKKLMVKWFEALGTGTQRTFEFSSFLNEYSVFGNGSTTFTDEVTGLDVAINANFIETKVYILNFTYDEEEGSVNHIPFSLTLWVAGI